MFDNKILEFHNTYNKIYDDAESLLKQLNELSYKAKLGSYNNHYIRYQDNYLHQKYYMPVITVEDIGDICFNIDGIAFEFYLLKEELLKLNELGELLNQFKQELNIYEYDNCTNDIYIINDTEAELLEKIKRSNDKKFGISIDCSNVEMKDIIITFNKVCSLLNLK